jgi:hypothetical protein
MRFWFIFRRRLGAVGLEVASRDRATIVRWLHVILGPGVGLWRLAFDLIHGTKVGLKKGKERSDIGSMVLVCLMSDLVVGDLREREFRIISIKWRKSNYIINTSVIRYQMLIEVGEGIVDE